MKREETNSEETHNDISNQIEDLTLKEVESSTVKGGSGRYLLDYRDLKGEATD